ncbi:MAG: DUF1553 domain-containing protein [Planctomycetaceae bacterium]
MSIARLPLPGHVIHAAGIPCPTHHRRRLPGLVALAIALLPATGAAEPAPGDGMALFTEQVAPLLARRCLDCHSEAGEINGGLQLDLRAGWERGGDSGPAIVPGRPAESLVFRAVRWEPGAPKMPPDGRLPPEEVALIESWIGAGAIDPRAGDALPRSRGTRPRGTAGMSVEEGRRLWCLQPLVPPPVPEVDDDEWRGDPIDRFIGAAAATAGIAPAPRAAPDVLLRRLFQDLAGLPPPADEIDSFLAAYAVDPRAATERVVDRLLADRAFGERFGRHWLDLARFAESSGGGRTLLFKDAWRYRDWVIDALAADLPFDRFLAAQLAGDLLAAASPAERERLLAATGFLTLGPTNYEEQDKQQLRMDIVDEQLDTLGKVFLGQSLGCARCHDHAFEPITQADYHALAGIFAATRTLHNETDNVARWITEPLAEPEPVAVRRAAVDAELAEITKALRGAKKQAAGSSPFPPGPLDPARLAGLVIDDGQATLVGAWRLSTFSPDHLGTGYVHDDNAGKGEKSATFLIDPPTSGRYEIRLAYSGGASRATNVPLHLLHADGEEDLTIDQRRPPPLFGRFVSLGTWRFEKGSAGHLLIGTAGTDGHVIVDGLHLVPEGQPPLPVDDGESTARVRALEARRRALESELPPRPTVMTVHDREAPTDTAVRIRGIEKNRGAVVPRGVPTVFGATLTIPADTSGRRELAEWLGDPRHPLVPRVLANRVWHWLTGRGIVSTVDAFGATGEPPSHPALLDHLATRLVADGYRLKPLVRAIVLSRAYAAAVAAPDPVDPDNRLFTRARRRRLDAEQIHDAILAAAGTLDRTAGGLTIRGAAEIDANDTSAQAIEYGYVFDGTRRGVYVPAFRNRRPTVFEVFDFADINTSAGARETSTVAAQALFFANDPFVVTHARATAARAAAAFPDAEGASAGATRVDWLYRTILGRPPRPDEAARCREFLGHSPADADALAMVVQALFGSIDFRYLQ